ncbi:sporulation protein YunB [Bacillaceae bacterium S4-13-58]
MRKYRRFKTKGGPPSFGQVFVITALFFIITTGVSLWVINEGIEPTLMSIAKTKTEQYAKEAINEAVSKKIADELQPQEVVIIEKNSEGEPVFVRWNSVIINEVLRATTNRVQNYLHRLEQGEADPSSNSLDIDDDSLEGNSQKRDPTITRIPIGQATNNSILANLGPRVPVTFKVIGSVQSDVVRKMEAKAINSVFYDLSISLAVTVQIVIPFATDETVVTTDIPIDSGFIPMDVPYYYNGGSEGNNPDVTLPFDNSLEGDLP